METIKQIGLIFVSNRAKSFYWRSIMMGVAGVLDLAVQDLTQLDMGNLTVVVTGLIFGEISKYINKTYLS